MYFDSLLHPTLDGSWINGKPGQTFTAVAENIESLGLIGACAVGLPGVGDYDHARFYEESKKFPSLYPVAALTSIERIESEVEQIKSIGFSAIKVHPRLLGIEPRKEVLSQIFKSAHQAELSVFLCTYYHCRPGLMPIEDPYWHLVGAIDENPETKILLLHGGGVRLLEYAELCRFNKHLLLDLSFTSQKYLLSSVQYDIQYLLKTFDRRICFGSDGPEYSTSDSIDLLNSLTSGLQKEKIENVSFRNIMSFLGIAPMPKPHIATF